MATGGNIIRRHAGISGLPATETTEIRTTIEPTIAA